MTLDQLKKAYGEEYPGAVVVDGERYSLARETRFSRMYSREDRKCHCIHSRFMDGSASITLDQLRQEWPAWSSNERLDFCMECTWLYQQSDFPDMLRFIMEHGGPSDWSSIALRVAEHFPQDEAWDLLLRAYNSVELSRSCNFIQALACTKHAAAEARLRAHLLALWNSPDLWKDDPFTNWLAYGATFCIKHLIELGAAPSEFEDHVHELADHVCAGNRQACRHLAPYFPWLSAFPPPGITSME